MSKKKKAVVDAANVERFDPDTDTGLTSKQVADRMKQELYNKNTQPTTKTIGRIFKDNMLTLFNVLNVVLGLLVFFVGSYKNMLFLGVMFFNTTIGIIQEIRAKKTIDKLSIVSATKVSAVRDGKQTSLGVEDIVLDDILEFSQGSQIPVDCIVKSGTIEVNESLLTGESDAIKKEAGDTILSGSFVVSGKCRARVEHVAGDNYASKISAQAKYVKKVNSEIMKTLNGIIHFLTFVIFPLSVLLFVRQYFVPFDASIVVPTVFGSVSTHLQEIIVSTVASMTSIIPEGLMLLSSTVLAVGVIRLSKYKVLVQELYCIETLARVDVLCLDKTGTITEGCMEVADVVAYGDNEKESIDLALSNLVSALDDTNATFEALLAKYGKQSGFAAVHKVPFSSEKKWSGADFEGSGTFVMGAAEFILNEIPDDLRKMLDDYSKQYRTITVAHSDSPLENGEIPKDLKVIGLALLNDKIRAEAPRTLQYFAEQDVDVRIISGDNPVTVSNVAKRAGVKNSENYVDATTLVTDEDIEEAMKKYTVFGRVTPAQKKKFVTALQKQGHTVAMTGDGVNDVLALKEADCSIAMASGSDAARSVSQLVLLDSNFASMPQVVAEGRRSINNIQRSATLFMSKTIFSVLLAVLFIFISIKYPIIPIQYTLINAFTIGIPSLILALEPNKDRIKGIFFFNILKNSVASGITVVLGIVMCVIATGIFSLSPDQYSTLSVCVLSSVSMMLLFRISRPFNVIRTVLFILMNVGLWSGILFFRNFFGFNVFSLAAFDYRLVFILVVLVVICLGLYLAISIPLDKNSHRIEKKIYEMRKKRLSAVK